jgi:hypothetical protein
MFEETVDDVVLNMLIHNCFTSQKIVDYDHVITNITPSQNHHPIKLFKINIARNLISLHYFMVSHDFHTLPILVHINKLLNGSCYINLNDFVTNMSNIFLKQSKYVFE